jgi:hypothetical protein
MSERIESVGRGQSKGKWLRCDKRRRCPVCDHDSWCSVSVDGATVCCMRVESDKPTKSGWLHPTGKEPMSVESLPRQTTAETRPVIDWDARANRLASQLGYDRSTLAAQLGVSEDSLDRLGVGCGYDDFKPFNFFWSFPEYNANLKCTGIVRRYRDGSKKTMKWSRSGLYIVRDWWKAEGPIFLVEGGSDTAAGLTMGLCVIGRPSNVGGVNLLIGALQGMRNRPVIVLAERDQKAVGCPAKCGECIRCFPGLAGARLTADALAKSLKRKIAVRFCGSNAKDLREWLNATEPKTTLIEKFLATMKAKP